MAAYKEEKSFPSPRVPILPSLISPPPTATRPIDYDRFNRGAQVTRVISSHRMDGLESRVRIIEQTQKELVEELTNVQKLAVHPMQSASPNTGQLVDFAGDRWTQVVYELRQRLDGLQSRLDKMPDVLFHRAGHGSSTGHAAGFLQQVQELTEHYEHLKQQFQQLRQDWARQKESITANLSFSIAESQGKANTAAINEAHKKIAKLTKDQNELAGNIAHLHELSKNFETAIAKIKQVNESRFSDIWEALNDLQSQVRAINSHHRQQEVWLKQSFSEIHDTLCSISKSHASFAKKSGMEKLEKQSLQQHAKLVDTICQDMSQSNKHCNDQFEQLKEEMDTRFRHLESRILITTADQTHQDSTAKKVNDLEKTVDELKQQLNKSVSTLTKSIALLDKDTQLQQKDFTKVLQAEIEIRKEEIIQLQKECGCIHERCNKLDEILQYSFTTLDKKLKQDNIKYHDIIGAFQKEWERELQLLGSKLALVQEQALVKKKTNEAMQQMEQKIASLKEQVDRCTAQGVEQKRTVDRLLEYQSDPYHRQGAVNGLKDMDAKITDNATQLYRLGATLQDAHMKLVDQLQSESNKRFQEIHEIKNELVWVQQAMLGQQQHSHNPQPVHYDGHQPIKEENGHSKKRIAYSPTPEPRSLYSSPIAAHKLRRSHRGRRTAHHANTIQILEPPETMGTFTSAPATPEELRKITVQQTHDDNEHDNSLHVAQDYKDWEEEAQEERVEGQEPHVEEGEELHTEEAGQKEEASEAESKAFQPIDEREQEIQEEASYGEELAQPGGSEQQNESHEGDEDHIVGEGSSLKKNSSVFIKSDHACDSWITEWGIYQALRLLQIKNRLMQPVYRLRQEKRTKHEEEESIQ